MALAGRMTGVLKQIGWIHCSIRHSPRRRSDHREGAQEMWKSREFSGNQVCWARTDF